MGGPIGRGKVVIAGGSGQIGSILRRYFAGHGREVVALGRRPGPGVVGWDGRTVGAWAKELEGAEAVINLAGRSVDCRYTAANRAEIMDSRVDSTRAIGRAIAGAGRPPRVWLQMGTATIYAAEPGRPSVEATGILGGDLPEAWRFSVAVARAWEGAAEEVPTPGTRRVVLRSAMVMSPDRGGVFGVLLGLARLGLGGPVAGGRQYVSWIHDADFARAVDWLIGRDDLAGPINLAAPAPLPHADFMRALRRAAGVPIGLPAARWMVGIGAWAMRTEPELILKSRRVAPGRLLESGFRFDHPGWPGAAADLCRRREGDGAPSPPRP